MSKQIEHVQFVSTLSKGRNFTIESFDIVAVCGNKVECCFDIFAGVDGALGKRIGLRRVKDPNEALILVDDCVVRTTVVVDFGVMPATA